MKKNIELYLTEFAPNGTNDLLIVNGNTGEVIDQIEEAAFGYPRCTRTKPNARCCLESNFVGGIESGEVRGEYDVDLYSVDADILREHFCVSPLDPNGARLDARLKAAGVDLSKGLKRKAGK